MQIYINKKEIQAIRNAWEEVNEKLECCMDMESTKELHKILKHLNSIDRKYKMLYTY
jgi:archaellum component FlaC